MAKNYDLVILGGGMGGYVSAIRASQLGLTVALVEADLLGGTCLHRGCIPTKSLLKSAAIYQTVKNSSLFGIEVNQALINFSEVQGRKLTVVDQLHKGVKQLIKKNKIDVFDGFGRLLGPSIFSPMSGTVSVEYKDDRENEMLIGKNVIVATGTKARQIESMPFDGKFVLSSDQALTLEELPESMLIVGGGVIGIEWASMLSDFGVKVTVIEADQHILPSFDKDISRVMKKELAKKGVDILTEANIEGYEVIDQTHVKLNLTLQDNEAKQVTADSVLVSIGRQAFTNDLGLENTSIELDDHGFIKVNQYYQTKESHIYAVGDCIGGAQLAHVAAHEGKLAVEHIANTHEKLPQENFVISCVYSQPEIATVGLTEQEAKREGKDVQVAKMPFSAIGKAVIEGHTTGFVKIISDRETEDIIGIHMMGSHVTDLISEAGLAMVLNATAEEIGQTIHPHPSLSEAIQETALAIHAKQIHG
ncbi:dihydrolipoyl dehydrogenase [Amphibacillus cookii]|uniref:dihydrolipoyl dehydrogenase n=1 Tax=Amphibacillus cookii TaxID=767787 RepID=UPI0019577366|nr:dihydrolipoyl dehydrogenase [Amphibacillus cookii]MBM7542452.1 dihydrolipoamide dehydrogenase [Amphibacillus cookii]